MGPLAIEPRLGGGGLPSAGGMAEGRPQGPVLLREVDADGCEPMPTGVAELDRVFGGGVRPRSLTLFYGEPGVGKSTLLLQVLASMSAGGRTVLLGTAEESAGQVRGRAGRVGSLSERLFVVAAHDVAEIENAVATVRPELVVVDSLQTVAVAGISGGAGSLSQVRGCAERLGWLSKAAGPAIVLVGHVTKEGSLAGPRALEHLVDTVVTLEGDRHHSLRTLRAVKHRFGSTGEIGLFQMGEAGMVGVADPGPLLLGDRLADVPGSVVTALLEGRRPLLVEIQALAARAGPGAARRNTQGIDARRLAAVAAVLEARAGLDLTDVELFVSAAGGIRASEPAADLPLALAVASAVLGRPLPSEIVAFGEVGLAGEIRQVQGSDRRLSEAARLGFTSALVPDSTPESSRRDGPAAGCTLHRVRTVSEAVQAALGHACRASIAAPSRADLRAG